MRPIRPTTDLICCSRGGGLDVPAQQVDLGPQLMYRVVIYVGQRLVGERVDQLCRLGRAALSEQRLGRIGGDSVGPTAVLAGRLQAA
jgi:hypothetical protein